MPLTDLKLKLKKHFDEFAAQRNFWIEKNISFYADDYKFMKFLVPENKNIIELGCGTGRLLSKLKPSSGSGVDISSSMIEIASKENPEMVFFEGDIEDDQVLEKSIGKFDFVIMSDLLCHSRNISKLLRNVAKICRDDTRVVISYHSPLWEFFLNLAVKFGLSMPKPYPSSWISYKDLFNLLETSGFQVIGHEKRQLIPIHLFGFARLVNNSLAVLPWIKSLCLRHYVVARKLTPTPAPLSVSIVVPCKNERENIESAILRTPEFCKQIEFIFVEGGSSDGTFEECLRVAEKYKRKKIRVAQQKGSGKGDAVRAGFDLAKGDALMILDADLTTPPEYLPVFYQMIAEDHGEFINGTRFVYPMQTGAMQFLNFWANRTFSIIFSSLLNQRLTDTLCGTKVLKRSNYKNIAKNRSYFGLSDPFGDFDLLFGAAKLNLKIIEVPVPYAERVYGSTQIARFAHGWLLLRMVILAFRKLKIF